MMFIPTTRRSVGRAAAGALALLAAAAPAHAVTVPFTEEFDSGASNWTVGGGGAFAEWQSAGGFGDDGGYITTDFAFADAGPFGATLFRASDAMDASSGALFGDWIDAGVSGFTFAFRHNAPVPVELFARFATPANFPGAVGLVFQPIMPDQWTEVFIPIAPDSPNLVFEGGAFADSFGNVGNIQIGVSVPDGFEMDETLYAFDLDAVSVIPAPGVLAMFGVGPAAARRRRRA